MRTRRPDRRKLDKAEAGLKKLDEEYGASMQDVARRRKRIVDEQTSLERRYQERKSAALQALSAETEAYKKAGGR